MPPSNRWLRHRHVRRGPWRWLARAPLLLYRLGLGGLLGHRFLRLTHYGRKSGRVYHTVVEVVHYDPGSGTYYIVAGFGPRSDWYRNLRAHPQTEIMVGRRRLAVTAHGLSPSEAVKWLRAYIRAHPTAAQSLGRLLAGQPLRADLSDEELADFARAYPMVALKPR